MISVDTAETSRLLTRIRASRQELKNAAYWASPRGPATLSASTRTTGHTTNASKSARTVAAVTPRTGSTRASRDSGGAGARATVAISQPAVKPPSTTSSAPVMNEDSSLARNNAT